MNNKTKLSCKQAGTIGDYYINRIYSPEGASPALKTSCGGGHEPKVIILGNYVPSGHEAGDVISPEGRAKTVMLNHGSVQAVLINNENE